MSAQAGIFYFDRRPISPDAPRRLLAALADHGPDGRGAVVRPGLVMVHRAMRVSREDLDERQPLARPQADRFQPDRVMTWDGRLDNRAELLAHCWNTLDADRSDAALAFAILTRHGAAGLRRLIGDWSLASFADETILLASDFAGNRPLYYWVGADALHWSTSLGELITRLDLNTTLNHRYLAGFLTSTMPPEMTPYAGVRNLRPAHAICWTRDGRETRTRFWEPSVNAIRYRHVEDYDAQLRQLFAESLRGRLRSTRPAWAELSGGLDSSAVCSMGTLLVRARLADAPGLEAVSAFAERSTESDESRFVTIVQEHCGLAVRRLSYERAFGVIDPEVSWVSPTQPSEMGLQFLRTVADEGGRTLLTGHPGDLVMGNVPDAGLTSMEAWRDGSLVSWLRFCRQWSRGSKKPIWSLLRTVLESRASMSIAIRRTLTRELAVRGAPDAGDVRTATADAFSLRPSLAAMWMDEMSRRVGVTRAFEGVARRAYVENLQHFTETRLLESPSAFPRVRHTHVYMHRPLVEFCLGIPAAVLQGAGDPRLLMRRAFDGFMPPRILRRFSKGYAAPLLIRDLRPLARTWLPAVERLSVVEEGLIDPDRLRGRLTALCDGSAQQVGNVREIARLEAWLRLRARRGKDRPGSTGVEERNA